MASRHIAEVSISHYKDMALGELLAFVRHIFLVSIKNNPTYTALQTDVPIVEEKLNAYIKSFEDARHGGEMFIAKRQQAKKELHKVLDDISLLINREAKGNTSYVKGTCMKLQKKNYGGSRPSNNTSASKEEDTPTPPE